MNHKILSLASCLLCLLALSSCKKNPKKKKCTVTLTSPVKKKKRLTSNERAVVISLKRARVTMQDLNDAYKTELNLLKKKPKPDTQVIAKKIKECAIIMHEDYLKSWSHLAAAIFEVDYTRSTPFTHYRVALQQDVHTIKRLTKKLQKKVQIEDKRRAALYKQSQELEKFLNELYEIVRFDIDFVRDDQAQQLDLNTRYIRNS